MAAIPVSVLVAGAAGLLIGVLERAARGHERVERTSRRAGIAAAVLLAAAVVAVAVVNMSSISDTVDEQWTTLTGGEYDTVEGARISNLDPYERPDYWRVAIDLFQESPVNGVGAGNFEREYTARRHEPKHSRYVHNMFLRALGEGGAVAALLLVGFFVSLFVFGALLRRRLARAPALLIATTLAIAAYFAVHLNFDWLEEIPAVASPAFALPIVALVAAAGAPAGGAGRLGRAARGGLVGAGRGGSGRPAGARAGVPVGALPEPRRGAGRHGRERRLRGPRPGRVAQLRHRSTRCWPRGGSPSRRVATTARRRPSRTR